VAYPGVGGVLLHGCGVRKHYEKSVLSYSFVLEATKHFLVLALGYCTSRSECSAVSVYDLILVGPPYCFGSDCPENTQMCVQSPVSTRSLLDGQ
jgi:hypothetical protein